MSKTSGFGTSKREGHDSSAFHAAVGYASAAGPVVEDRINVANPAMVNRLYSHSSEYMRELPSNSAGLVFTSPPYHVGKEYDTDESFEEYLELLRRVFKECWRILQPGARLVVNVANLGRRPYIRLNDHVVGVAESFGFLHTAEIIWQKADGAGGNCAWGSWRSASNPSIRDLHEYLLVFSKGRYGRLAKGTSTISGQAFMESTLSIWKVPPESAKRIGHPAPFPVALAERVINLYSFQEDIVVDPFVGSGTTCLAAQNLGRQWVGYDTSPEYLEIAARRLGI